MRSFINCAKLNLRMLGHVLGNRWLNHTDIAKGYDRLASEYDVNWLANLIPVSERLLAALPEDSVSAILDLGCGTGYLTATLEKRFPLASITGVDISPGMLTEAGKICPRSELVCSDMLDFLRHRPDSSADLIVSGWAIGYSVPNKVIAECARVLTPNGTFAFTVNYADTLAPVFHTFRKCMAEFPEKVNKALWPRFPRNRTEIEKLLRGHRFDPEIIEEGKITIAPPANIEKLPWLLKTGIIAGFESVLPLREDSQLSAYFEQELQRDRRPIEHHYIAIKGIRR